MLRNIESVYYIAFRCSYLTLSVRQIAFFGRQSEGRMDAWQYQSLKMYWKRKYQPVLIYLTREDTINTHWNEMEAMDFAEFL